MKRALTVQNYMTYSPKTIDYDQPVSLAAEYMRKLHIRHLPVLKSGKLIGILRARDIKVISELKDVDISSVFVKDAFTPDAYFTKPDANLSEVTTHMAREECSCALVLDNGKLVGVFSDIDAIRALAELLST